jgi:hypothetical protein
LGFATLVFTSFFSFFSFLLASSSAIFAFKPATSSEEKVYCALSGASSSKLILLKTSNAGGLIVSDSCTVIFCSVDKNLKTFLLC